MIYSAFQWCGKQINRVYNSIWTSQPWFYTWGIKNQLGQHYIKWLMRHNNIPIQNENNPLWPYVLGELTQKANKEGIARKDLYILNTRLNILGYEIPLKLRGFTLMSVTEKKAVKKLCDLPARAAFDTPAGLVQLPNFVARKWDKTSRDEKMLLKSFLSKNQHRLWLVTQDYCEHLSEHWNQEHTAAQNMTLMTLRIIANASFGIEDIPDEMYQLVEEFEDMWQYPEHLSGSRFNKNINEFMTLSKQMHAQKKTKDKYSKLETDFVKDFYQFHNEHTTFLSKPEDLNVASFLAIFGNLPKAIIGMSFLVLSNPKYLAQIEKEKLRINGELKELGIHIHSKEALDYLLSHSELFQRFYYEVLRFWFIAPVIPRLNMNMLFNQIGGWGDDMQINEEHSLPPRGLAICPQRVLATDPNKWESPETFNPHRSEYQFKQKEDGRFSSVGEEPMVFGDVGSPRVCPGREISRKIFFSILWWLPEYNQFKLTQAEQQELATPAPAYRHTMSFEPETNSPVKGILEQFKRTQDFADVSTEVSDNDEADSKEELNLASQSSEGLKGSHIYM